MGKTIILTDDQLADAMSLRLVFTHFTFHSMERIVRSDMASRLKEKIYKAELDTAKAEINRYCKNVKVYKSVLYSNVKPVETVLE